ncbi:SCO6880 family protein [Cryobacterium melibiosiphilum]|uniref:SCO6880 family protein n=1 Tax=Cryobacterium melibiosiphilum TaxID=995039 RepID=UPI0018F400F2|nr:SCO6880 family protein [Cryobacterium melibiosiphilum]
MTTHSAPRSYGNWTKPKTAGLLGLGSIGTAILFVGAGFSVIVTMASNILNGVVTALIFGAFLLTVAVTDKHGQSLLMRATTRVGWMVTTRTGTHIYRSGPLGRAEWGTAQLPGLAAGSKLSEWHDSYNRPFALLQIPTTSDYTVVIETEPDGAALVDREQVDVWVAEWGMWLASLGDEPGIEAVSVTIETAPDTGTRLRREVNSRIDPEAPEFAQNILHDLVKQYPAGSATIKAFVAITFNAAARVGGKKRTPDEMGRELASRLPGLTQSLSSTGAGATRPLSAQELCEVIRVAYDPAAARLIDDANAAGEVPELYWPEVGPTAHQANWDTYRHDSALSVTWMMSGAPRGNVPSSILARLLAPHRDVARKRVTLLYRPIDAAKAAAIVEADVRASTFNVQSSNKPTARSMTATRAALATAQEEASGAGLVNFGMLVTATVIDAAHEADAKAAIDNLSATARLRLRIVHGSQDSAFAAALPLGLVLPKHVRIPSEVREQL